MIPIAGLAGVLLLAGMGASYASENSEPGSITVNGRTLGPEDGLVAQVLIPPLADASTREYPETRTLVVPYSIAAIAAIACIEIALIAVWRLLSMISGNRIFTPRAFTWVNVIILCVSIDTALSALIGWHLVFVARIGGPLALLGPCALVSGGIALVLLLVVLRGLLHTAVADREELAEVI